MLGRLPLGARVVHMLHDLEGEFLAFAVTVRLTGHIIGALVQTCVAQRDGRVAAVEQLVDGLALFQAAERAILPEDRRHIRASTPEAFMPAAERTMTQLQTFIEDFPEAIFIAAGGEGYVGKVDRDDALVNSHALLHGRTISWLITAPCALDGDKLRPTLLASCIFMPYCQANLSEIRRIAFDSLYTFPESGLGTVLSLSGVHR